MAGAALTVALEADPRSAGEARRFLDRALVGTAVSEDTADTAALLLSEVVTNAVLHARTDLLVRCRTAGAGLLLEVQDRSPLLPKPRRHDDEAVSGRGLELVELLAERFGVLPTTSGKVVWFTLGGAPAPGAPGWRRQPAPTGTAVVLHGLPVRLYAVLQEHHEALLREFSLYQQARPAPADALEALGVASRIRLHIATTALEASALADGPAADVRLVLPPGAAQEVEVLLAVFDAAERTARAGELLVRPALPELLALRNWMYGEVLRQLRGAPPRAWDGRTALVPDVVEGAEVAPPLLEEADVEPLLDTALALVVADEENRIAGASAAVEDLLGWRPDELVGRRLTTIVPPELREAHLTGFVRHGTSGRSTILGRPADVVALARDGRRVAVRLLVDAVPLAGSIAYTGVLAPR